MPATVHRHLLLALCLLLAALVTPIVHAEESAMPAAQCPKCTTEIPIQPLGSINGGRKPQLREAVLDGSIQRYECPSCSESIRIEPECTYIDLKRKQFLTVWPTTQVAEWKALEARSKEVFDLAFGEQAPEAARSLGEGVTLRAVFGWAGLREYLLAADAGIDAVTLECAKLAVIKASADARIMQPFSFRMIGLDEENLHLAWLPTGSDRPAEELSVPRTLLGEIEADADSWKELRSNFDGRLFIDFKCQLVGGD